MNKFLIISIAVAVLSCVPFFIHFERKKQTTTFLVLTALMTAFCIIGRIIFGVLPAFKPMTAIIIIAAVYLGKEAGFMIGALSALLSNIYFGQGPWTPFQMLTWGLIGFFAAVLSRSIKKNRLIMCLYGVFSGVAFSLFMDIWSSVWVDGRFNASRFVLIFPNSIPYMIMYAVSNVVFLMLLMKPVGKKIERVLLKSGNSEK